MGRATDAMNSVLDKYLNNKTEDEEKNKKQTVATKEGPTERMQAVLNKYLPPARPANELRSSTYVGLKHGPNQVLINNTVQRQQKASQKKQAEDYIFMNYSPDRQKSTIENLQKQLDYAKSYNKDKRREFATSDKTVVGAGGTEKPAQASEDYIAELEDRINRYAGIYYNTKNQTALEQIEKLPEQKAQYESASQTDADNEVIKRVLDKVNTGNFEWDEDYDYIAEKFGITTDNKSMEQYRDELMSALDEGKQLVSENAASLGEQGFDYEGLERYKAMLKAQEEYDAQVERAKQNYEERPFLTNLQTVANAPGMAIEAGVKAIKSIGHNDIRDLDSYVPMDKTNMPVTTYVQAVRQATDEDIDSQVLSFLYNTGMSVADSTVLALTLGPAATVAMGGSAAASYMQDAVDRGLSNKQILAGAMATGAAEAVFEKFSIDKLLNGAMNANTVKEMLRSVGVQAAVEGTEEMFTEVANIISDGIIAGRNSTNAKLIEQYMAEGMTEEEAKRQVVLDNIKNVALAGIGGALSGGVTAGGIGAVNVIGEKAMQRRAAKAEVPATKAEYSEKTQELLNRSYEAYSSATENPISFESYAAEFEIAYEYGKNGIDKEYVMKKEHTPHMTNAQLENAYDEGVIERLKTEGKKAVDSNKTQDYTNVTEVNDEEEIRLRRVGNGLDGENTGRALRQLEEGTGRNQIGSETVRPADVETASLTYGEKVSTSSLGILGGSTKADIRIVKGGETQATREAKSIAKQRGLRLVLFAGDNLHIEQRGSDGKLYNISARAFVSGDRVFVRADHPQYTSAKLIKHEAGHDMIAKGEVNPDTVRERIKKEFTEEGTAQLIDEYVKGYEGSGMTPEEIWEELICDSLADMNVFSETKYESVERILQPEIKKAATKPDAKTDTTRGPPAEGKASREPTRKRAQRGRSVELETMENNRFQRLRQFGENLPETWYAYSGKYLYVYENFNYIDYHIIGKYPVTNQAITSAIIEEVKNDAIRTTADFDRRLKALRAKAGRHSSNAKSSTNRGTAVDDGGLSGDNSSKPAGKNGSIQESNRDSKGVNGKASRELDTTKPEEDLLTRLLNKRAELQEFSILQDDLEDSDEYNTLVKEVVASKASPEALAKYREWDERTGYSKLVEKNKLLAKEARELAKQYDDFQSNSFEQAEKAAIAKSGLSEADYFRKQAVKEFGYTPYFYDAGYLLPNGKMLNFSGEKGKHYGTRGEDHRGIGTIYANTQGTEALIRFMNDGNIRVMAETPGVDISSVSEPTTEQYSTIKKFINEYAKEKFFSVDLSDESGRNVGSLQYENNINATRIINDIKHFYATGEIRTPSLTSQFHYSREIEGMDKLRKEYARIRTDLSVLSNAANALDESAFNKGEGATLERFKTRLEKIRETEDIISKYRAIGDEISTEDRNRLRNAERRVVTQYSELFDSVSKPGVKAITAKASELLIQKYGSIEPGEKPFREVSVPARTNKGNKVSRTVRTAMEAEVTSDEMAERLSEEVIKGGFSYIPITDAESKKYADDTIKRKGWNDALLDWTADVNKNQLGKNNVALGFQLYNNALNAGDTETAVRILTDLASRVREGAQMVQAVRMLKKLSPEYQLYGIQRSIQTLQDSLNERYGDKAPQLEMDSQLVKNYEQAEIEEAREAAQEAIYRQVAAQIPHTFMDKWNSWRYLAMLFNPRTHVRNILGNAAFAPVRGLKNTTAALIEKLIPQEQRTKAIASGSKLYKAALEDYKIVADQITGAGKYNDSISEIERLKPAFGSSKVFIPLNKLADFNSNALEVEDMWFSKPAYASALAGYLKARGITDMSTMKQADLDKARAYAIKEAQKATYRDFNDFSNFISAIGRKSKAKNKVVAAAQTIAEGVLPFRRTPANILVRGIEYSPLGLVKGIAQATRGVKNGTATAADAIDSIASGLVGSALMGLGILLVKLGVLSAGEDKDKKQQEFDELMGGQNYALDIGDKNITIDWLAPEALPLFVGAEIANVLIENDGEFDFAAILEGVSRISEPMLEMSMLSSLQDVIENVSYSDGKLQGILVNALTSYLMQGLPTLAGQIERVTETERETTWVDRNKTQVERDLQYLLGKAGNKSFGEYQQIPYIDAWGRRESTGTVLARIFNNMLNPAYVSEEVSAPVDNELQRLYDLGYDEVFPSSVSQSDKIEGEYLSADEYVQYAETKGQRQRRLIEDVTSAAWYEDLDDTEKSEVIKKAYDYASETSKRDVKPIHEVPKWVSEVEKTSDKAEAIKNYALNLASEEMSSAAISKYYEEIESSGIDFDTYKDYYTKTKDVKGEDVDGDGKTDSGSKKKQVMEVINNLNISNAQKDTLYLLNYKESTIDDAPWH